MKLINRMRGKMQDFVVTPGGKAPQVMKEYSSMGGIDLTHS
jgi:hypothetical protein